MFLRGYTASPKPGFLGFLGFWPGSASLVDVCVLNMISAAFFFHI